MIRTLLIANRGEIACRIIRTCRSLGIGTVAVASDPDLGGRHVRLADRSVHLAGHRAAETYLDIDALIGAAHRTGADAIHPGYGFLSENAQFAEAVTDAGLIWVGPPAHAIAAMGSKIAAKELMHAAGVPVLPSTDTPDDPAAAERSGVGYPLLLKASAGGGGRGMRIVRSPDELAPAVGAAQAEALAAFGDDTLFAERYVERGRHIEVQVVADRYGEHRALFERECSIQRRHQKIIEEAPSPVVTPELRARLCAAALLASEQVGYVGAGTVEFLLEGDDGPFWFLEMNTRLQVEHPVTEMVTGLDLVELQLRIAEGARLGELLADAPDRPRGHAIEVRLTAEDPAAGYLPASGTFEVFEIPDAADRLHPDNGLRLDSGVESGDTVSPHADSMVAKLIAHGPTREAAIRRLEAALARARLHGPVTNIGQLRAVLAHPEFRSGRLWTGFLDAHPCTDAAPVPPLALVAAALALRAANRSRAGALAHSGSGWRNVPAIDTSVEIDHAAGHSVVRYRLGRPHRGGGSTPVTASVDDTAVELVMHACTDRHVVLEHDAVIVAHDVHLGPGAAHDPDTTEVTASVWTAEGATTMTIKPRFPAPSTAVAAGSLTAPMPGAVRSVHVVVGQTVATGEALVSLEAMKMEHVISAPASGVVTAVFVSAGDQVETGRSLLHIDSGEPQEGRTS